MIIRAIDSNGDWTFGKGKSSYKKNENALEQNLRTKLYEWKGDCFFDIEAGVDWKNRLSKTSQILPLQNEVKAVILKVDGVTEVLDLDFNFNSVTRNLDLEYSIRTIYSTQPIVSSVSI